MNNPTSNPAFSPIWKLLHRFHVIFFVVIVFGSLSVATLFLYATIVKSSEITATATTTSFDKETIDKVNELKTAEEQNTKPKDPPMSNRNPFYE
jgi:hypothetical protein